MDNKNPGTRQQILVSDKFCEIGSAGACKADYSEHIAPKSPQKYRLGSNIFSELIVSQAFKLAQSSQIGFPVPPCSDGSEDPPERHCPDPPVCGLPVDFGSTKNLRVRHEAPDC